MFLIILHVEYNRLGRSSHFLLVLRELEMLINLTLPNLRLYIELALQGITLVILTLHTFFPLAYEGRHYFWKDHVYKWKV